jgi:methionyl-tRNA formyltransferase
MKIVFFGTPEFAVPTLKKLSTHPEFEVVATVTQPDKRRGRGKDLIPSPVKKLALELNLPVWQSENIKKDRETLDLLQATQADVFAVIAYGQILSKKILAMPKLGCINVHGSILPKYRGAAPIQWSIYNGDKETGITTMLMDAGMDTGDMLLKKYLPIGILDNAWDLSLSLADLGADLLIETLQKLKGGQIESIPQNPEEATYASLIQKEDYGIEWHRSAIAIHNQIRGFYPNCVAMWRDKPIKILSTIPLEEVYRSQLPTQLQIPAEKLSELKSVKGKPGEVVNNWKNFGPIVQTGDGFLLLKEVQLAGKRPQSGWDLVNGMRLLVGEIFANG